MPPRTEPASPPAETSRDEWRLDVSAALPTGEPLEIAATLVRPAREPARALLFCLPGGFLSRRYFDMEVDGDRRFSFAEHMAGEGFATLSLDHLGVGESSRPADGWALDPSTVAAANQLALEVALARWGDEGGAALPTVGVGHSMGSCLSVVQQALHAPHAALLLFSFTTKGLPAFMQGRESAFAGDPAAASAHLVELAKERFGSPYPSDEADAGNAAFTVGSAPPEAARALQAAETGILPVPATLTMIPGGYSLWTDAVRVPCFVAVGDQDLHPAEEGAASLPNAAGVASYTLEDCWHCHHVANTRLQLWKDAARWVHDVLESDE